jgi:DNA-binding CsgD family transcriptional regulator
MGSEPRATLREAVRRLERARTRDHRGDPESLALWEGLVRGRWSLVDRFDSDGRRFVVAHRNEPNLGDPRGLSAREHQVAEHVGVGRSNKEIAYELGISESAVANAAARAQRKLGLRSRPELASFFAAGGLRARLVSFELAGETFAVGSGSAVDESLLERLTPAEREVTLHLLRGATNAEVARRRGTSPNTVANQVQSIFDRLGVGSRVELAARLGAA